MAFGDGDLSIFFRDGDEVTRGDGSKSPFMAHFDVPEKLDSLGPSPHGADMIDARPEIRYATADAPDLARNELLTVRGVRYRVRNPHLEGDGQVSVAELSLP